MRFDKYKNKKIYFLGIGGISMYAIALLLKSKGAYVFGYDRNESETTKTLIENGIPVFFTPSEENSRGADFCVCTAAIGAGNEEYDNVYKNGIPIIFRGQMLGEIIECFDNSIGISGTHGKSTTSGMISQIYLEEELKNPTIMMGAVLPKINSAYNIGGSSDLIFEACEYKDSFLSFKPRCAVILNVSLDHTDYFENLDQMKSSFTKFAHSAEKIVVNKDCKDALECANLSGREIVTYSVCDKTADYFSKNVSHVREKTFFDLYYKGEFLSKIELSVPGEHNLSNSLAAIAASLINGISLTNVCNGIKSFKGIKRRLEYLGSINGAKIYDDYAHHPDEINATLDAVEKMGFDRVVCLFQPHTYTRLSYFFDDFVNSFDREIKTVFLPVYAAREVNKLGYDSEKLSKAVLKSEFIPNLETAAKFIMENAQNNEIYILMGAGDITNVSKFLKFDA